MNNSLERLFEGMADTLRRSVIPCVNDEFARGQAFGVIFMLNSIARRAAWSPAFIAEQLAALHALADELSTLKNAPSEMPKLESFERQASTLTPVEARDLGDKEVSALIDWLSLNQLPAEPRLLIERAVDAYIHRQLKFEISTSAKPMFAEISRGAE